MTRAEYLALLREPSALAELQRLGQEFDAPDAPRCKACEEPLHECCCPDVIAAGVVPAGVE